MELDPQVALLTEISKKLDTVIAALLANGKDQDEQIRILRELEHDWPTIGKMVGLKPDAARKRYSNSANGRNGKKP